jgi:hypothetical protein
MGYFQGYVNEVRSSMLKKMVGKKQWNSEV